MIFFLPRSGFVQQPQG